MKSHIAEQIRRMSGAGVQTMYLNTVCNTDDGMQFSLAKCVFLFGFHVSKRNCLAHYFRIV